MKTYTISAYGKGDFTNVQSAVDAIPEDNTEQVVLVIKEGRYKQRIVIDKPYITLLGEGKVILTYDVGANDLHEDGKPYGTFRTPSVKITGHDFTACNVIFENLAGPGNFAGQALAVHINGDRSRFLKCSFKGYQDTIYTGSAKADGTVTSGGTGLEHRMYFRECYIEGDVDFIFGNGTAVFSKCEIYSMDRHEAENRCNGYITAASTNEETKYGYVFLDCRLTSASSKNTVYLGRPWRDYAYVAFLRCEMGEHIREEGWHNWSQPEREKTSRYIEYGSYGSGGDMTKRVNWSKSLEAERAKEYTVTNILSGTDLWQADNWEGVEETYEV